MSVPKIVALDEEGLEEAARVLALAFQDDPLFTYVVPEPQERALRLPVQFAAILRFGRMFGEALATAGTPLGALVAQPPGADITPERARQSGLDGFWTAISRDAAMRMGRVLDIFDKVNRADVPVDNWYVMAVGVLPEMQGRGIGSSLVRPIMDKARESGLPCLLDTPQPRNVPFYEKLGFRIHAETFDDPSGLRLWTFRLDP